MVRIGAKMGGLIATTSAFRAAIVLAYTAMCVLIAASCARRLAPLDVRTVTRVEEVPGVDQETAYSRALVWFSSNHDRATIRITGQDPTSATILGTGEMQCSSSVGAGLRAMGMGLNQNYLCFNVAFQAKDGRLRIAFAELFYYVADVRYSGSNLTQGPSDQADVDTLYRECLNPVEASLMRALDGGVATEF